MPFCVRIFMSAECVLTDTARYLYAQHSRDRLKTTRDSLAEILTYHQVMPAYLDFMLVFGAQSDPKDLRFSGFREHVNLKHTSDELPVPVLGRSGRTYQICYNLKSSQFKRKSDEDITLDQWSIRQSAIYHAFDVESGTTLWIVTKGGEAVQYAWFVFCFESCYTLAVLPLVYGRLAVVHQVAGGSTGSQSKHRAMKGFRSILLTTTERHGSLRSPR
jgi:hypothetical protein